MYVYVNYYRTVLLKENGHGTTISKEMQSSMKKAIEERGAEMHPEYEGIHLFKNENAFFLITDPGTFEKGGLCGAGLLVITSHTRPPRRALQEELLAVLNAGFEDAVSTTRSKKTQDIKVNGGCESFFDHATDIRKFLDTHGFYERKEQPLINFTLPAPR